MLPMERKKGIILMKWQLLPGLLILPFAAHAWGPATHAVIAMRIHAVKSPELAFAAGVPDINAIIQNNSRANSALKRLTHYEFDRLAPSLFRVGLASHNAIWGADHYAHRYYHPEAPEIFSTRVITQLHAEFGISMQEAEDIFEITMDYLNRIAWGPELGELLAEGARNSGDWHDQLMIEAYAQPFADRAGYTQEYSANRIRGLMDTYRQVMIVFGGQLAGADQFIHDAIPVLLDAYTGCGPAAAAERFERCIELSADFESEMDRIAEEMRLRIQAEGACGMPAAGRRGRLLLALLLPAAGLSCLFRGRRLKS
jgi:hypothetical protein